MVIFSWLFRWKSKKFISCWRLQWRISSDFVWINWKLFVPSQEKKMLRQKCVIFSKSLNSLVPLFLFVSEFADSLAIEIWSFPSVCGTLSVPCSIFLSRKIICINATSKKRFDKGTQEMREAQSLFFYFLAMNFGLEKWLYLNSWD